MRQDLADHEREDHATDRAGHATDTDDRAHGFAGEHVGSEGEDVGRPALVRGRSERDEEHRGPHANVVDEDDRNDADSADAHCGLARRIDRPAGLDEAGGDPPTADAADIRNQVDSHQWQSDVLEVDAVLLVEETRDPEEVEPPDRVGHELTNSKGPRLAELEQAEPTDLALLVGWIGFDMGELGRGDGRVFAGRVVGQGPPDDPGKADGTRDDEGPLPSPGDGDPRNQEGGAEGADVGARIEDAGREGALLLGEPFSGGLDRGREVARLAQAQDEAHQGEARGGSREGHPSEARLGVDLHPGETEGRKEMSEPMAHGGQTPDGDEDDEALLDADAVDDATREHHADGVGELEAEDDGGVGPLIPAKLLLQGRLQQANDLTVDIVDCGGEE